MKEALRQAYLTEMNTARAAFHGGVYDVAFHHLERAHVLSQRHTLTHAVVHMWMLRVGWCRRDAREVLGQIVRIFAAALFSHIWVPLGNTGGANVSAIKPMPVPQDLARWLP